MSMALVVLGCVLAYVVAGAVATPIAYRQLRPIIRNTYSIDPPGTTAKWRALLVGLFWPLGFFALIVFSALCRIDERHELDRKERAELDKFRERAMEELDSL